MTVTIDLAVVFTLLVGGLFVTAAVLFVVLFAKKVQRFLRARQYESFDREVMRRRWEEIERMLQDSGEVNAKLAVLEADKLLDHALKTLAFPGKGLGDRLKFASYKYPRLKEVWWAHKVRNQLAHEASYHLDRRIARKAIVTFKRALERLGAI